MRDTLWALIDESIASAVGGAFKSMSRRSVGGGSINQSFVINDGAARYFVKLNTQTHDEMFAAEADGLRELAVPRALRVPRVIANGVAEDRCFLVLEYIEFSDGGERGADRLGERLARLHRHTRAQFGWERDNTIGSTPQSNRSHRLWPDFYAHERLEPQFRWAVDAGYRGVLTRQGEQLLANLGHFFSTYKPQPSLLHGDLWSGNYAYDESGDPVIFDPAVYYGDREADIAMTELFGGFPSRFYAAYRAAWPLDDGYAVRKTLYNLYHVLNHFTLFGGGYARQAEHMVGRLLAELK